MLPDVKQCEVEFRTEVECCILYDVRGWDVVKESSCDRQQMVLSFKLPLGGQGYIANQFTPFREVLRGMRWQTVQGIIITH